MATSSSPVINAFMQITPKLAKDGVSQIKAQANSEMGSAGDTAGERFGSNFMSKMKGIVSVAAVAAVGKQITGALTDAVSQYAEFEQLAGGAELMWGSAYEGIMQSAQLAYNTVQMSQSDYLQQVNGFAVSFKTALGGDEQAAAELAKNVVKAEADIVAATGNSEEAVQNAFNGIIRGNFSMVDNLGLGINATKAGVQEVIDKVNDWNATQGKSTKYSIDNIADIEAALVDYVDMQGLAGYAAGEASTTISGSLAASKAAFANWVVAIASGEGDINANTKAVIGQMRTTIGLIIPTVANVLGNSTQQIAEALPQIVRGSVDFLRDNMPSIASAGLDMFLGLVSSIGQSIPYIVGAIPDIIWGIVEGLWDSRWQIVDAGYNLIMGLGEGIQNAIGGILDKIWSLGASIVSTAKEVLGIHSPSKVFEQLGEYTMEGYEKGIDKAKFDTFRKVDVTMNGVVSSATGAFGSYSAPRGITINNLTVNAADVLTERKFESMLRGAAMQYA